MDWAYWIGTATLVYFGIIAIRECLNMVRMMYFPAKLDMVRYGEWALVTGCTDGIGKQYCLQMLPECSKFILVGRNSTKLNLLHEEMKQLSPSIQVEKIVIDFATFNDYESLSDLINGKGHYLSYL